MADPTDPTGTPPDVHSLEKAKELLEQIFALLGKIGNQDGAKKALAALSGSASQASNDVKNLHDTIENTFTSLIEGAESGKAALANLTKENLGLDLNFDFTRLRTAVGEGFEHILADARGGLSSIQSFLKANRVNLAEYFVFSMAANKFENNPIIKQMTAIETVVTSQVSSVAQQISELGGSFRDAGAGTGTFLTDVEHALTGAALSAQRTGLTSQQAATAINTLGEAGINLGEVLSPLNGFIDSSGERITELTETMRISAQTGIQLNEIGRLMQVNMRQLGRSVDDTGSLFAALTLAQSNTKLSMSTVSKSVVDTASSLRFYGTNVESLANTFNAFVRSAGSGREALGQELFASTMKNIEGMNFGLKAFLGMQSQVGQGRGAIGAGLEFEQALSEGRTGEIFTSIREQLERLGGGQILTRKEALDTGQENQYMLQRQLLGKITGNQDAGQLESLLGIIQRGEVERATEAFVSPERLQVARRTLDEGGQQKIDLMTGAAQQGLNKLRAEESEALGKMVGSYGMAANDIRGATAHIISDFEKTGRVILDTLHFKPTGNLAAQITNDQEAVVEAKQAYITTDLASPDTISGRKIEAAGPMAASSRDLERSKALPIQTQRGVQESRSLPVSSQRTVEDTGALPTLTQRRISDPFGLGALRLTGADQPQMQPYALQTPAALLQPAAAPITPPPAVPAAPQPTPPQPLPATARPATPDAPTAAPAGPGSQAMLLTAPELDVPVNLKFSIEGNSLRIALDSMEKSVVAKVMSKVKNSVTTA